MEGENGGSEEGGITQGKRRGREEGRRGTAAKNGRGSRPGDRNGSRQAGKPSCPLLSPLLSSRPGARGPLCTRGTRKRRTPRQMLETFSLCGNPEIRFPYHVEMALNVIGFLNLDHRLPDPRKPLLLFIRRRELRELLSIERRENVFLYIEEY